MTIQEFENEITNILLKEGKKEHKPNESFADCRGELFYVFVKYLSDKLESKTKRLIHRIDELEKFSPGATGGVGEMYTGEKYAMWIRKWEVNDVLKNDYEEETGNPFIEV